MSTDDLDRAEEHLELLDAVAACHAILDHLREAEREATPPSAGDGDEFRQSEAHTLLCVEDTGDGPCGRVAVGWKDDGRGVYEVCGEHFTPPPAPVDEAPVEGAFCVCPWKGCGQHRQHETAADAMARVLDHYGIDHLDTPALIADLLGAVPGYGPTGASVGAKEVEPWALRQAIGIIEHAYNGDEMVPGCLTALRAALDTA